MHSSGIQEHQSAGSAEENTALLSDNSSTRSESLVGGKKQPLSSLQLLSMTVLLAGIQFVWTVELGYGTPYLLSLGLSKPLMTLVWMAGPLSGLLIQPVVGSLSDRCFSKLGRRRPFIIGGATFVVVSVITIAYAREMAQFLAQLRGMGASAEPGSEYQVFVSRASIVFAVIGFYVLDFSINTSQACARALALDIPPLQQQDLANAYAGRMLNLGSVSGYMVGFMDLRALLPWKTDSQMQALCLIATLVFVVTITWTCVSVREQPLVCADSSEAGEADEAGAASPWSSAAAAQGGGLLREWADMFRSISQGVVRLPTPVQRVCNVQFFAWVAWFPFLFFATTWVTEVMARTAADANDPDFVERATRAGSFALFLYSIASLGFSVVLPVFVRDDDDNAMAPTMRLKLSLRSMWRLSLVAMCVVLLMTYIVADVRGATVLIIAMAFPWSLAMWAPFALVGEYVSIASAANSEGGGSAGEEAAQSSTAQPVVAQMVPGSSRSSRKGVYGACDDDSDSEMLLGRSMCDDLDDDEFIVGSQSTAARWAQPDAASAAAAPSKRQSELAGHLAVVQRRGFAVRGDSIASTIGAEEPSLPPNSTRVQLLKTLPLRAGEDDRLVEHSNSSSSAQPRREKLESGAILGIHNMYVVLPQFVINALSSLVFAWLGGGSAEAGNPGDSGSSQAPLLRSVEFMAMDAAFSTLSGGSAVAGGREAVGTVLRIGGASALVAAVLTLFLFDRRHVREYISAIQQ